MPAHRAARGLLAATMLTLGLAPARLQAQIVAAGPEFQVNTFTQGNQKYPDVAADADGNFIVAWSSFSQDGVFGQRYDSGGSALGSEFRVSTSTLYPQYSPSVGAAPNGDFVVVWFTAGPQDGDGYGVFGQRFASNGTKLGGEFQVNTYTYYDQTYPAVAVAGNGDFVVVWDSYYQDNSGDGIFGRRYASNGGPLSGEFQVNTYTYYRQRFPDVAAASNGDFVVVWASELQDGSGDGIFAQRFASNGSVVGSEFQVNTFTQNRQSFPSAAAAADGSFVVTWSSGANHDGDSYGIFGQRYDSSGAAAGTEFQINTYTTNTQIASDVAAASNGDFVVTWQSRLQDGDQEASSPSATPATAAR